MVDDRAWIAKLEAWATSQDLQGITWSPGLAQAGMWAIKQRIEDSAARKAEIYRLLDDPDRVLLWMLGEVSMSRRICADIRKARRLFQHVTAGITLRDARRVTLRVPPE